MKRSIALAILCATLTAAGCSASPDEGAPLPLGTDPLNLANNRPAECGDVTGAAARAYPAIGKGPCGEPGQTTWSAWLPPDGVTNSELEFEGPSIANQDCVNSILDATNGSQTSSSPNPCGASDPNHVTLWHCAGYPGHCNSCIQ